MEYNAGLVRGLTHSQVLIPDGRGGVMSRVVGDDRPLVLEGYRFYTTYNKGFAPVLTWTPDQGEAMTGTIHMPSYPLFDYKQDSTWTPPGGKPLRFWLRLDTGLRQDAAWLLDGKKASGVLVVNAGERRVELLPGQSVRLEGGSLRYERLTSWMGYKVFYDPTLRWLFIAAVVSIMGLGAHFWRKFGVRMQRTHESSVADTLWHRVGECHEHYRRYHRPGHGIALALGRTCCLWSGDHRCHCGPYEDASPRRRRDGGV